MSCRPLDVESFRNRARLPKGITRRKRGGYDESKKVSRTLLVPLLKGRGGRSPSNRQPNRNEDGDRAWNRGRNSLLPPKRFHAGDPGAGECGRQEQGAPRRH